MGEPKGEDFPKAEGEPNEDWPKAGCPRPDCCFAIPNPVAPNPLAPNAGDGFVSLSELASFGAQNLTSDQLTSLVQSAYPPLREILCSEEWVISIESMYMVC